MTLLLVSFRQSLLTAHRGQPYRWELRCYARTAVGTGMKVDFSQFQRSFIREILSLSSVSDLTQHVFHPDRQVFARFSALREQEANEPSPRREPAPGLVNNTALPLVPCRVLLVWTIPFPGRVTSRMNHKGCNVTDSLAEDALNLALVLRQFEKEARVSGTEQVLSNGPLTPTSYLV